MVMSRRWTCVSGQLLGYGWVIFVGAHVKKQNYKFIRYVVELEFIVEFFIMKAYNWPVSNHLHLYL